MIPFSEWKVKEKYIAYHDKTRTNQREAMGLLFYMCLYLVITRNHKLSYHLFYSNLYIMVHVFVYLTLITLPRDLINFSIQLF